MCAVPESCDSASWNNPKVAQLQTNSFTIFPPFPHPLTPSLSFSPSLTRSHSLSHTHVGPIQHYQAHWVHCRILRLLWLGEQCSSLRCIRLQADVPGTGQTERIGRVKKITRTGISQGTVHSGDTRMTTTLWTRLFPTSFGWT